MSASTRPQPTPADFVPLSLTAAASGPPGTSGAGGAANVEEWLEALPFNSEDVERAMSNRPAAPQSAEPDATGAPGGWHPPALEPRGGRDPVEDAYRRGYREGTEAGGRQSAEPARRAAALLLAAAQQVQASGHEFARHRERDVQALAMAVARLLVQRELRSDPAIVVALVRRAVALVPADDAIEVRLRPDDLVHVQAAAAGISGETPVRWIADPALEPGGFVVEGPKHRIDGRTDTALRALFERLGND